MTAIKIEATAAATYLARNVRTRLPVSSLHIGARTPSIFDRTRGSGPPFAGLMDCLARGRAARERPPVRMTISSAARPKNNRVHICQYIAIFLEIRDSRQSRGGTDDNERAIGAGLR
ncbi:MAG: hypothetical protein ACLP8B_26355, partial [Xanthobacteraceae bacterium]